MKRKSYAIAGIILGLGLVAGIGRAQGPAERVGETVDSALRGLKEQFARAKTAVNDMGIEARVYGRLHWDKALNGVDFTLEVRKGGIATLRAIVPSAELKTKALALTSETVGITQVIDQVVVSRPETTKAVPATP